MKQVCLKQKDFEKLLNLSLKNCESQNCLVGGWNNWSNCSTDCGGGVQTQNRSIIRPGKNCPELQRFRKCNIQPCSTNVPISRTKFLPHSFINIDQNKECDEQLTYCGFDECKISGVGWLNCMSKCVEKVKGCKF